MLHSCSPGTHGLQCKQQLHVVLPQEFFKEVREVDRDNEVLRILGAFKLNPLEQLGLRFDATPEDVKRQYRKASLLVHPDKCKHPQAQDAFEVLGHAHKQMQDETKVKELVYALGLARGGHCGLLVPSFLLLSERGGARSASCSCR